MVMLDEVHEEHYMIPACVSSMCNKLHEGTYRLDAGLESTAAFLSWVG